MWHTFLLAGCLSCARTVSINTLKETQSTDPTSEYHPLVSTAFCRRPLDSSAKGRYSLYVGCLTLWDPNCVKTA